MIKFRNNFAQQLTAKSVTMLYCLILGLTLSSCAKEAKTSKKSSRSNASNIFKKATKHINNITKFSSKEFGVKGSPRVSTGKKVRKGGGRYQVGKPYTIRGKKYYPKDNKNLNQVGMASWYGPNFHGRLTANGEVYDQYSLSAAHPTMPLPSYAKVTNISNGRSVIVRVNDRGPYAHGRVIDLSAKAAELLDYTHKGVTKVRVQYHSKARMDGLDHKFLLASYNGPNENNIHPTLEPFDKPSANDFSTMIALSPTQQQPTLAPSTLATMSTSTSITGSGVVLNPSPQNAIKGNFGVATGKPLSILPTLAGNTIFEPVASTNVAAPSYQIRRKPLAYVTSEKTLPSFEDFDKNFRSLRPYLGQAPLAPAIIILGNFKDKSIKHELIQIFGKSGKIELSGNKNTAKITTRELFANSILAYAKLNGLHNPFAE